MFPLPIDDDETEESKLVKKLLNYAADPSTTINEARRFYEKALSVAHQNALDFNDAFDLIDERRPEISARQQEDDEAEPAADGANASEPEAEVEAEAERDADEVVVAAAAKAAPDLDY